MTNEQIREIAMASIEILNKERAVSAAERAVRKAVNDRDASKQVHFDLVAKYSGAPT